MKLTTIAVAAFSLALLAGCDRGEPRPKMSPGAGSTAVPQTQPQSGPTPSSANNGKTERQPVQQQVDPKQPEQNRDFKTNGK